MSALYDAKVSATYLGVLRTLRKRPEDTSILEQTDTFGTRLGAEIAFCCEQFMVDAYLSDAPPVSPSAMSAITEYCQWRRAILIKEERTEALQITYQHKTMGYVKKLISVLPSE